MDTSLLLKNINLLMLLIMVLVAVAFFSLAERKLLSSMQIRLGPNKMGFMGILQPFSDAIKLFTKNQIFLSFSNYTMYLITPILMLVLSLMFWLVSPKYNWSLSMKLTIMLFLVLVSLGVYTSMIMGLTANSKYSILGSLRSMAQTISYEISLILIVFSFIYMLSSFNSSEKYFNMALLIIYLPFSIFFYLSLLAETNRTPFDLTEGESELVSGFNTEFMSGSFALIFMSEYSMILIMSLMFVIIFMFKTNYMVVLAQTLMISLSFIWIRGTVPRIRYDNLMMLAWKIFLTISLYMMLFTYTVKISLDYWHN
uniref:NADH-ubiquinone oxidoreductase chain 1 n=1 Tax=Allobathynella sp. JHS-2017 TaxID=2025385 RepID=A0A7R6D8P6_9CRUS|nr:NADH dehydrogenase subunit 1 [Allobathynella sp. JHS-2017]